MANSTTYPKYIFCLETELDNDLRKDSSTKHILDQLYNYSEGGIKYIYRKYATKAELIYYLNKAGQKKYDKYSIIYISAHGFSNGINIGNEEVLIEEIATTIGISVKSKILHFGSCESVKMSNKQMNSFFKTTQSLALSGFTKEVDFFEEAAMTMLYFSWCQEYKQMKSLENKLLSKYKGLVKETGFKMLHRN